MNDIRTVHAEFPGIVELVRYDRSGKWYVEYIEPDTRRRRHVGFQVAVAIAGVIRHRGGSIYTGRPGGGMFDRALASTTGVDSNAVQILAEVAGWRG